jgi:hypothetical protein
MEMDTVPTSLEQLPEPTLESQRRQPLSESRYWDLMEVVPTLVFFLVFSSVCSPA